jgi:hypothetical protein
MSRFVTALLATSALAFSAPIAVAQTPGKGSAGSLLDGSVETCQTSGGGTRVNANCELEQSTVVTQLSIAIPSIKPPDLLSGQCEVAAATSYQQRNTLARVVGTIQVTDCTAAAGTFTVAVRVRDDAGDRVLDFRETWQRDAAREVGFAADYPIGENAQLLSVRVRNLTCACADEPDAAAVMASDSSEPGER